MVFDDDLSGSDNEDREDLPFKRSDFSDDEDVTPDVVELTGCTTPTELEPDLRRAMTEADSVGLTSSDTLTEPAADLMGVDD